MTRVWRLITLVLLLVGFGLIAATMFGPRIDIPAPPPAPIVGKIDRIVIEKAARRMQLFQGDQMVRSYAISLGFTPEGDKTRQGDGKTPEGEFIINRRNEASTFHLSLGIDYPQPDDVARAAEAGYSPGGDIFIHGQPKGVREGYKLKGDWTSGCIAVSNAEIEEIWGVTPIGTKVVIRP